MDTFDPSKNGLPMGAVTVAHIVEQMLCKVGKVNEAYVGWTVHAFMWVYKLGRNTLNYLWSLPNMPHKDYVKQMQNIE